MSSLKDVALIPSAVVLQADHPFAKIQKNADYLSQLLNSPHIRANTRKNFKADWNAWSEFITRQPGGLESFMAITQAELQLPTLQAYVEHLIAKQLKASTIKRFIAGLSTIFKLLGVPDGCSYPLFTFYKKTTLTALATPAAQAKPVRLELVNKIRNEARTDGDIRSFRAAVIVQLAYDTLCRASELIQIRQSDVLFSDDGTGTVFIRKSKTDQAAIGAYRFISKSTVTLVKQWIAMANEAGRFEFLLCPVSSHSNKIRKLKKNKEEISIGYSRLLGDMKHILGDDYSAHSTRVGSLLDLVSCPENKDLDVQLAGGWKSNTMVAYYSRHHSAETGAMARLSKLNGR